MVDSYRTHQVKLSPFEMMWSLNGLTIVVFVVIIILILYMMNEGGIV